MRWHPRVTVAAVIRNSQGQHLLVEEKPRGELVLNQPAGHLEEGESLIEAVIREVREETCRAFTPKALIGVYHWQIPPDGDTYLRFCFIGEVGPELPQLVRDPDILATHWILPQTLEQMDLRLRSPMVSMCIQDADSGTSYPLAMLRHLETGYAE